MPQSRELLAVLPSGAVGIRSFLTSRQAGPRYEFVLTNEGGSMTKGSNRCGRFAVERTTESAHASVPGRSSAMSGACCKERELSC